MGRLIGTDPLFPQCWTHTITCGKLFASHAHGAPVAQLDRASGYEPEGREFESPRAHHFLFFFIYLQASIFSAHSSAEAAVNPYLRRTQTLHSVEKGRFSTDDQSISLAIPRKLPPNGN